MKSYAGIGSRKTPENICKQMTRLASFFEANHFRLRSGGANGADSAFQVGIHDKNNIELYLPYNGFNNNWDGILLDENDDRYTKLAQEVHPLGENLPTNILKYHRRNCAQILGLNLDNPVKFVLCWTPDGAETKTTSKTGGTGQAIRLATKYNIPVINMANSLWKDKLISIYNCCTFDTLFN